MKHQAAGQYFLDFVLIIRVSRSRMEPHVSFLCRPNGSSATNCYLKVRVDVEHTKISKFLVIAVEFESHLDSAYVSIRPGISLGWLSFEL